MPVKCPM
jgi:hypothetical protein